MDDKMTFNRKLVLEDGSVYPGHGFGAACDRVAEIFFDTAVVGYQELLSDPGCTDLIAVMTYPLIGNYGITDEDFETRVPTAGGLVVSEYNDQPSNFRYTKTLAETLEDYGIPGIEGIDTRALTRHIRDHGVCRAILTDFDTPTEDALEKIACTPIPHDQVMRVSCRKKWYSRTANHKYNVVAVDCGIKLSIIRALNARGCNVTVVPWNTTAYEILKMKPDGVLISNGPGSSEDVLPVVETVRALRGKVPLFGISLGHLIIARAYGASTYKLKFGHHGGNHPVRNLATGKLEITAQGHSCVVDPASLVGTGLTVTHVNVLDNTVEGLECAADRVFSVQYHPESNPGPQDSAYLFDRFLALMKGE
ncbi:MAG: glutamine-hydrolyzing carbamoyl-phosphate synthase small subunit [Eubacteriales bacterium]